MEVPILYKKETVSSDYQKLPLQCHADADVFSLLSVLSLA